MKTDPRPTSPPISGSNVKKRKAVASQGSTEDLDVDIVGIEDVPTKKSRKDKNDTTFSPSPSLDHSKSIAFSTNDLKKAAAAPSQATLTQTPNVNRPRSKPSHVDSSATSLSDGDTNSSLPGSSDGSTQKRVLPSRRGQLRDKTALPMDAAGLLGLGTENPRTPAGEYILYLAKRRVLEQTSTDPKRIPPAAYGASEDEAGLKTSDIEAPAMAPPPSATTHIEVPIFKLCSIAQFLQEEKKRKIAALTKALAKAEAIAEAEALAASGTTPTDYATASQTGAGANRQPAASRTVSTRQKHKEIASHQQISILAPTSVHGKKATTTIGKKEGSRARLLTTQEEDLRDEVYEKRHKKQETAEKKVKNREKEKLRHAMYQQQLVVEKLRHIEINRLMPISAFRSLQKSVEMEQRQQQQQAGSGSQESHAESSSTSLAAAKILQDKYYRRLLREAEENLRRYEQLGLGDSNHSNVANYSPFSRTKDRLTAIASLTVKAKEERQRLQHSSQASASEIRSRKRSKPPAVELADETSAKPTTPARIRTKNRSTLSPSQTPDPRSRRSTSRDPGTKDGTKAHPKVETVVAPPKPITTFIKPGSILPSGSRKSNRVALAFGEKVPTLERVDFSLPMDDFGVFIRARNGEPEVQPTAVVVTPAMSSVERTASTNPEKQ
ncbi:hypothetical protein EMPS_10597 [Entomortierella parvispora]|uniref:Something about silencing protein 4 domain-containing protein n=1 Tax=Entomortierella parvispora TaxID=205924 RepID=A0A9P3HKM2_9FUNG|nr:hypothetical protein EMPS_10597 [Entomortierella parvispora]